MEKIVKAIKFGEEVNTFIGDIINGFEFAEEIDAFIREYLHEHPDKIDDVIVEYKLSNPSFSLTIDASKVLVMKKQILKLS